MNVTRRVMPRSRVGSFTNGGYRKARPETAPAIRFLDNSRNLPLMVTIPLPTQTLPVGGPPPPAPRPSRLRLARSDTSPSNKEPSMNSSDPTPHSARRGPRPHDGNPAAPAADQAAADPRRRSRRRRRDRGRPAGAAAPRAGAARRPPCPPPQPVPTSRPPRSRTTCRASPRTCRSARPRSRAVVQLLDEENTVPFITRYRKERTGGLNEEVIRRIQDRVGGPPRPRRPQADRSSRASRSRAGSPTS